MLGTINRAIRTSSSFYQAAQQARQLHRSVMPQGCVGLTTSPTARDINDITLPRGYRGGCREAHYHPRQYRARACAYPSEAPGNVLARGDEAHHHLAITWRLRRARREPSPDSEAVRPLAGCYRAGTAAAREASMLRASVNI